MANRTVSLKGMVFGTSATTTIPTNPVAGVTYRDTAILQADVEKGWPFSEIIDSKNSNEILYRIAAVLNQVEKTGIPVWSALTDYPAGAFVVGGTDAVLYQSLLASGPNSGGTKDPDAGANPTYWKILESLFNFTSLNFLSQGRLNLPTATSVSFTPYNGNNLALYTGAQWEVKQFIEVSLALTGFAANTNFDIFAYSDAGTLTLEAVAWASDTVRATALVLQDGIKVKSGSTTKRYLGTIRTTSTIGQSEDSAVRRFCWNENNKLNKMFYFISSASHSYTTGAWRYYNNDANNKVEMVCGEDGVFLLNNTTWGMVSAGEIGLATADLSWISRASGITSSATTVTGSSSEWRPLPLGYLALHLAEFGYSGGVFTTATINSSVLM